MSGSFVLGHCEEELPKKPVGQLSVICWPTVGQLSADCRPSVGRLSAVCWPTVGRLSAVCRPTGFLGSSSSQGRIILRLTEILGLFIDNKRWNCKARHSSKFQKSGWTTFWPLCLWAKCTGVLLCILETWSWCCVDVFSITWKQFFYAFLLFT